MPFSITCACGKSYSVPDEHAGKPVQCSACDAIFNAMPAGGMDPAFLRDKFLLRQPAISLNEEYRVWDEKGSEILYVERPSHIIRNILALGAAAGATLILIFLVGVITPRAYPLLGVMGIFLSLIGGLAVLILLQKKRDIFFYRDETKSELALKVYQDQKFVLFRATYSIADAQGNSLGRFCKNYLHNIFRKRWDARDASGKLVCVAKEDSIILSIGRRLFGPLLGLLRTNFILVSPNGEDLGAFNRKFTLLDRYVLDLTPDSARTLDRRLALALGVLLDTGEKR